MSKSRTLPAGDNLQAWFLVQCMQGEHLFDAGRFSEAMTVFEGILAQLGRQPSYERAHTLRQLGRCLGAGGRPDLAVARERETIAVLDLLVPTDDVKRERGIALTDLGDALMLGGDYGAARNAYDGALEAAKATKDERHLGTILGQLGSLAFLERRLDEAERRFSDALSLFQRLDEPTKVAIYFNQLGLTFDETGQWEKSDEHYRKSAAIWEEQGRVVDAAQAWHNLARVNAKAGRSELAENWYRKAIEGFRSVGGHSSPCKSLSNLADLLQSQPGRLTEARQLAEEALKGMSRLDPNAVEIWKTHNILAQIADRECVTAQDAETYGRLRTEAKEHRRHARTALRAFPATRRWLQSNLQLIRLVADALPGPPPHPLAG